MDPLVAGMIGLVLFVVLLFFGVYIAVAMFLAGTVIIIMILDLPKALQLLGSTPFTVGSTYGYSCLPLFLLMGTFAVYAGVAEEALAVMYRWVSRLPGSLAVATTLGCGAFGAASGSSLAAASVFTRAALPVMVKYKYDIKLVTGCIAASGTFATMIPPSILLIVYGIFTETSIAKLFLAGILPGLITVLVYTVSIVLRVRRSPQLAPMSGEVFSWKDKVSALPRLWTIAVLALVVIGGIYGGLFTPTEAAAVGALAAFVMNLRKNGLKHTYLPNALKETAYVTAQIFIIIIGAVVLSRAISLSQIPVEIVRFVSGLAVPRVIIITGFLVMYFLLGMVVTASGMLAITLPVLTPIIISLGYDLIWFGIIAIKMCEIAVVTPPVGLNVYIVAGAAGKQATLEQIFAGIWPFVVCDFIVLALLIAFPQIVLFLPNML